MMHCVICHNNDRTIEDLTFKFEKLLELHNALSIKVDNMQKLNQTMISGILREMRTDRAGQDEWIRKVEYNVKQIECTIRQHQMIANPTPKPDFVEVEQLNFYMAYHEMLRGKKVAHGKFFNTSHIYLKGGIFMLNDHYDDEKPYCLDQEDIEAIDWRVVDE